MLMPNVFCLFASKLLIRHQAIKRCYWCLGRERFSAATIIVLKAGFCTPSVYISIIVYITVYETILHVLAHTIGLLLAACYVPIYVVDVMWMYLP
jgi:hypothetical protein